MLDLTTIQLLDHLQRGGAVGYWWVLEGLQSYWWQAGKRTPLPEGRLNVYFGVHPADSIPTERKSKKTGKPYRPDPRQTRPLIDEIAVTNCVFAEYDAKDFGDDKHKAYDKIQTLDIKPSVLVDSGGGYHLYWLFAQPWLLGTSEERTKAGKLQAAWVRYVESDPQSKDLARVLRVPGTYNHKYNPPRKVEIVEADFTRLYDPAEIAALCAHLMESDMLPQAGSNGAGAETDIAWARTVLGRAVAQVVAASDGKKHGNLLRAATLAGGIAHLISEDEIETTLYNAIKDRANDPSNARKTIQDGIAYGKQKPLKQENAARGQYVNGTKAHQKANPAVKTSESWTHPLPFIHHDLPTFPVDTLTPWLRDYVIAETEAKQTPLDLAAMLALAVLSTACARYVMVEAKPGWIEPVNLYTVTALPPASRKSPMFSAMVTPINAYERELMSQAQSDIALQQAEHDILEARLQVAKREAAQAKTKPEQMSAMDKVAALAHDLSNHNVSPLPRYIVDDITTEMLSSMLAEHGRIAALSPEGDIFSIMSGRYSGDASPNFGVYLKAHAGDTLRVDRRGRPSEFVEWPALTMGLTVQPDVIRGFGDKRSMRGLGLLGRFLYALPVSTVGRRKISPDPVPPEIRMTYNERITYLLRQVPILAATYSENCGNCGNKERGNRVPPGSTEESNCGDSGNSGVSTLFSPYLSIYLLQLDPAAYRLLEDWQTWLEPHLAEQGAYGAFADWSGKLSGEILRIAGLLYLSDYADHNSHNSHNSISVDVIARAITIGQYLIPHARAAFIEMGTDPAIHAARRVLSWIEQAQPHEFTKREAYQATKGTFKHASDLDPVLELLTYHSYIRPIEMDERSGPGRRPSQRYEVNPLTFVGGTHSSHLDVASFVVPMNMPVSTNVTHVEPVQETQPITANTQADTAKLKAVDTALGRGEYAMARGYANGIQDAKLRAQQIERISTRRQEATQ
jgi:replicative DNA helicase